jgi:KEOPS complex subunit Pcc1
MALQSVKTTLEIKFENSRDAGIVLRSLEPEFQTSPQERSSTSIDLRDNVLRIEIDAVDTTSLRAALNSYLKWIILSCDVLKL